MQNKYYEIQVIYTPREQSLLEVLHELSVSEFQCDGIEEYILEEELIDKTLGDRARALVNISPETMKEVELKHYRDEKLSCKFYFYQENCQEQSKLFYYWLNKNYSNLEVLLLEKESEDWNESWREGFTPIYISDLLEIVPSWQFENYDSKVKHPISIYPGQGFGTGNHETTELCLKFLSDLSKQNNISEISCLDFGCGSGILGIAALKLGAAQVSLYDIDPEALENCWLNIKNNFKTFDKLAVVEKLETLKVKKFSLVVANILLDVVISEKKVITEHLEENGLLIISGLLVDQFEECIADYTNYGAYSVIADKKKGDWGAILFKKEI